MSRDEHKPRGYVTVGQGDDVVEWHTPFNDLDDIDHVITYAEEYGIDIPWKQCVQGVSGFRHISDDHRIASALDLLDGHAAIDIDRSTYGVDDDMPGRSGCFVTVSVQVDLKDELLGELQRIRGQMLSFWEACGGSQQEQDEEAAFLEAEQRRQQERIAEGQQQEMEGQKKREAALHALCSSVVEQIRAFRSGTTDPYLHPEGTTRLLCVRGGPIYLLAKEPYESNEGTAEARRLGEALEKSGFRVIQLAQQVPEHVGHISYLAGSARRLYQGWLQQNGVLTAQDPEVAALAIEHRARHLEWRER